MTVSRALWVYFYNGPSGPEISWTNRDLTAHHCNNAACARGIWSAWYACFSCGVFTENTQRQVIHGECYWNMAVFINWSEARLVQRSRGRRFIIISPRAGLIHVAADLKLNCCLWEGWLIQAGAIFSYPLRCMLRRGPHIIYIHTAIPSHYSTVLVPAWPCLYSLFLTSQLNYYHSCHSLSLMVLHLF